jgi:hypothetical protein
MKAVLGVFGLCLGLAASVVIFAEIGHVRQVAPGLLPGWTRGVAPGAGLLQGRAEIAPESSPVGALKARWRWQGVDGMAPRWALRLSAPGLDATGTLRLPRPYSHLSLADGAGNADLRVLSAARIGDAARGDLRIDDLTARLRLGDRRLVRLDGSGRILGLHYEGVRVGDGTVGLSADAGGGWRVAFDVSGPAGAAQGRFSGLIGAEFVTIDATVTEGAAMPQRWRDRLSLLAGQSGNGTWRIRMRLP